jgi:hypothetical protein
VVSEVEVASVALVVDGPVLVPEPSRVPAEVATPLVEGSASEPAESWPPLVVMPSDVGPSPPCEGEQAIDIETPARKNQRCRIVRSR